MRSDNALVIKNIDYFSAEILPKHFKYTSFKSFEKQVQPAYIAYNSSTSHVR